MLLSNRRGFLVGLLAFGAGCGFQPVYGPNGTAQSFLGQVEVIAPVDRNTFDLMRRLEERFGRPASPIYGLAYTLDLDEDDLAITPAQEITRYNITGSANFTLTDISTDAVLTSGTVQNFTSYSATGTTVGTLTAQRDAYARLMVILADQVVARLLATSGSLAR